MLKPFGKYDTKGDGVIVYVCVCNVRAGCWHLLADIESVSVVNKGLRTHRTIHAQIWQCAMACAVLCLDRAIIILTRNSPTDFTFLYDALACASLVRGL